MQPSFFDYDDRLAKLNARDSLMRLNELIEWAIFRDTMEKIRRQERKSPAGRKPFDALLMFKGLVLQHLYEFSDEELEYQIRDRFTFMRFLDLTPEDRIPDANTFWDFREALIQAGVIKQLFHALLVAISDVISEQLDIIPAQIRVLRHIRKTYACDCGRCIKTAPIPAQPTPRVSPHPACWRTSRSRSIRMHCRCTGRSRSCNASAWTSRAPRWRTG